MIPDDCSSLTFLKIQSSWIIFVAHICCTNSGVLELFSDFFNLEGIYLGQIRECSALCHTTFAGNIMEGKHPFMHNIPWCSFFLPLREIMSQIYKASGKRDNLYVHIYSFINS